MELSDLRKYSNLLAHHEQSETTQDPDGMWYNVYGAKTPQAGVPLPIEYEYEDESYINEPNASAAALLRSLMHGQAQQFTGGNLPGRRSR